MNFDPRVTAARPDLAAAALEGKVAAARFVAGEKRSVARGRAPLHVAPSRDSGRETELLFGEIFTVYEDKDGWCWGQAERDLYVGYVHGSFLGEMVVVNARVSGLMTPLLPACDVKTVAYDMLPLNALVKVEMRKTGFARLAGGGHVSERHLAPLDVFAADWVAVAERFIGVPYLWGGKTQAGLDCSGLIQTALQAAGMSCPRDTDMQEKALGKAMPVDGTVKRGDLIFWKGHVGVMRDQSQLLHANAFHMQVACEPLADALARIEKAAGPVTSVRRLSD